MDFTQTHIIGLDLYGTLDRGGCDEDIAALLLRIKGRYRALDLITTNPHDFTLRRLDEIGISPELFTNVITGDVALKADGSAFRLWLSKYKDAAPDNFLYIGDSTHNDCHVPRTYGILAALVRQDDSGPCPTYPDLSSLLEQLAN